MTQKVVLGTRSSKLALWQTTHVADLLRAALPGLETEIVPISTQGDRILDKPLPEIGGKGLFTLELEAAILDGSIDLAVHSLKDLPTEDSPGLTIGAIIGRADVRDALVSRNGERLADLPLGAVVGTSSIRRQAQLLAARPDLTVRSIRGNVDTRIRKVMEGEYDAAVLAAAGIVRLGLEDRIAEFLSLESMLPAPGQGALAVQCRANDERILALMAKLDDARVRAATDAERTFLQSLGGGCSAPVGAYAEASIREGALHLAMQACIGAPDGSRIVRVAGKGAEARELAARLADEAIRQGAASLISVTSSSVTSSSARAGIGNPLAGVRVLVARASDQASEFSRKLREHGALPVEVPLIATEPVRETGPLDEAIRNLHQYDWIVFTSANGVRYFYDFYERVPGEHAIPPGLRIAAVGPATDAELARHGRKADYVPAQYTGGSLAEGLDGVEGKRILLVRAEVAGKDLPDTLRARGALVDEAPVYRTTAKALSNEEIDLLSSVAVIALTSGSSARSLTAAAQANPRLADAMPRAVIACIGPSTAQVAAEVGLRVDVVAESHTLDGLIEAIVAFLEKEQR